MLIEFKYSVGDIVEFSLINNDRLIGVVIGVEYTYKGKYYQVYAL